MLHLLFTCKWLRVALHALCKNEKTMKTLFRWKVAKVASFWKKRRHSLVVVMGELKLKTGKEKKKRHSETDKPRASRHWAMDWPGAEHKNAWILCARAWQHDSKKLFPGLPAISTPCFHRGDDDEVWSRCFCSTCLLIRRLCQFCPFCVPLRPQEGKMADHQVF